MSAGKAINAILINNATVAALVSDKVFPIGAEITQAKPYIVYSQISTSPEKTKDRSTQVKTERFQLDIFAETYSEIDQISDAVVDAMSFQSGTFAGIEVDIVTFEDENDFYNDQAEIYRKEQDYLIRIK